MRDVSGFSLGSVLAAGTRHYVRNLSVILPISLLAFSPAFLVIAIAGNDALRFDLGPVRVGIGYGETASLVCGVWLQAGLSFGVIRHLDGGFRDFGEDLIGSISSLFRSAHVALVVVAVVFVGFMAFVLPGLVLATVLWVAVPSVAVEQQGLARALARSYELTRDHRLRILGLVLILIVIGVVVHDAISLVFWSLNLDDLVSRSVVLQFGMILVFGLIGSVAATCYHDLRTLKEGAASKALAQAFE